MSAEAFAARSRAAFSEYFPVLAERLADSAVQSSVVMENGNPIDIRIDGQLIYGGDAKRFTANQVSAYLQKPLRFTVQRLDLSGVMTAVGARLVKTIENGLRDDAFGKCTVKPENNPTFLIIFGLGLGHHVKELVRETKARWLIIVEPLLDFFQSSFHVVDWTELIEEFKGRGGSVHIIPELDPARIVGAISHVVMSKGIPYADGSWVFTHYPFWAFTEARNRLHEAMEFAFINRGFYEDELVMMRNAVENYATHDCWLLEDRPHLRRPEIAVVTGAGPSLDDGIETLHRIRDKVVLFSAGTSLRALLRHGLVPDFHCELENVPAVHQVIMETAKIGDLSQIRLLAAATIDPRVPSLFRDVIFYFRDSVSSTEILKGKHREIYGTSPTCVNLALTAAAVLGFTDFALFGTDCGTRTGSSRHAKGTVYDEVGVFKAGNESQSPAMQVEGNFGGVVNTEIVYDSCRLMLAQTIGHYGLNVVNCSDGALIPGAHPRVPEALNVPDQVIDRGALKAALERGMRRYAAGQILEEADMALIRRQTKQMFTDLDDLLVALGEGEADFAVVYDRVMAFVREAKDRYGRTESIISGSLQALPRIAMFYGFRVAEEEGRQRLFALFIDEFRAIIADMAANIYGLFDRLEKLMPLSVGAVIANTAS